MAARFRRTRQVSSDVREHRLPIARDVAKAFLRCWRGKVNELIAPSHQCWNLPLFGGAQQNHPRKNPACSYAAAHLRKRNGQQ